MTITSTPAYEKPPRIPRLSALRSIGALILREISTTHARSPGGYIWAVLEPGLGIALLVLLFSTGLHLPPLGTNFALFYASGLLPFFMFVMVEKQVGNALMFSRQLLEYPRVGVVDAVLARFLLSALTQLSVSALILGTVLFAMDTRATLVWPAILSAFCMAAVLGLGIGILNAFVNTYYPIWQRICGVITRPLILISGVIFLHERIPQPYQDWLLWNPLVHITAQSRLGFYYGYRAPYISELYVIGIGLVCASMGLLFLRRYYRDSLER